MKLNKLTLTNIGAYRGHYVFDLSSPNPTKNVILFGGKNGAGKTTLLDSIRITLFGPLIFGLKTESDVYIKKISSLLNRTAVAKKENFFQIILEFEQVEDLERVNYKFIRRWNIENKKPKETFFVQKNEQFLKEQEINILLNKMREEYPPQLFDLCLFDGEEIARIINDDLLSDYFKNTARVLFNLDLFENLEYDLNQYLKQSSEMLNKSEDENQIELLKEKLEIQHEKKSILIESIDQLTQTIQNKQNDLSGHKKDFEQNGGLIKKERDELIQKINQLENQRKNNIEQIKLFISELLPFFIAKDLLSEVMIQVDLEKGNETYEHLCNSLKPNQLLQIIQLLESYGLETNNKEELTQQLLTGFLKAIKPNEETLIHRASFSQRNELENISRKVNAFDPSSILNKYEENQKLQNEIYAYKKQIEQNDASHDFKELLKNIEVLSKEIESTKLQLNNRHFELEEIDKQINITQKELERVTNKVLNSNKTESTFVLSTKIIEISKKFRSLQMKKKIQQVEFETTRMIKQLFRKDDFVHQIKINPDTFALSLYSSGKETIDQHGLSAGEKEILLLCIIWAMVKTSRRRLPFIFDTLLGRLDQTHKKSIITKFIPQCGDQVVILSTDSEIDLEYFHLIKPILSHCYTIDFDKNEKRVCVDKDQYFDFYIKELSQ